MGTVVSLSLSMLTVSLLCVLTVCVTVSSVGAQTCYPPNTQSNNGCGPNAPCCSNLGSAATVNLTVVLAMADLSLRSTNPRHLELHVTLEKGVSEATIAGRTPGTTQAIGTASRKLKPVLKTRMNNTKTYIQI